MFARLSAKLQDAKTISALCAEAERIALASGNKAPGSEHFLLASISLPDGTSNKALASLGVSADNLSEAISTQFANALSRIGVEVQATPVAAANAGSVKAPSGLYEAAASGQSLLQRLAATAHARSARSLLSADVLLAAASEEFSVAARALRVLKISSQQLTDAATREIAHHGKP